MLSESRSRLGKYLLVFMMTVLLSPSLGYAMNSQPLKKVFAMKGRTTVVAASSTSFPVQTWKGKKQLDPSALEETIEIVHDRLPQLPYSNERRALLMETVATESSIGKFLEYKGNYGVTQFNARSAKYLLTWLKDRHPDMHVSIMGMYNKKKSMRDNLKFNVPFNIAMCATYYWHRNPKLTDKSLSTVHKRSRVWKRYYNTSAGAGTPRQYVKRSTERLAMTK